MTLTKAIEVLKEYIILDREIREIENCSNDYDKFCEEKCVAIETVLNYVYEN